MELKKDGRVTEVDAKSLRIWRTKELPRFLQEEQAVQAEREAQKEQRPPRVRTPTTPNPQIVTQNFQEAPASPERPPTNHLTPSPARSPVHQQVEQEVTQPEVEIEHREPTREPQEKRGSMDRRNYSNAHTDNIIGDRNAGRSTRNRPNGAATFTAQDAGVQPTPYEILGRGLMEVLKMSQTMDELMDKQRRPHEAKDDKRDNTDSLERD